MVRGSSRAVGDRAERIAERYLLDQGLQTIRRNYHCRLGEIDLVMLDGRCLVFVEVRFRSANRFSSARASVDGVKRRKLIRTAATFLAANPAYANNVMRFDVIGVDRHADGRERLRWIRDAFRPSDSSL